MSDIPELTLKDKKILKELDLDARQSNSSIAKKVRLSKNIVNYRIKRLEELGIIKGYNTVFDYSKLGYFLFRVYMDFYEYNDEKVSQLLEHLMKEPKAGWIASTVGAWDLAVAFHVKNVYEFKGLWKGILDKFNDVIRDKEINIITQSYYYRRAYILGEKQDDSHLVWKTGASDIEKVDDIDFKIVKMLAENAREPIGNIAVKTGLSSMTIIYRIKQLIKKKIILGYRTDIEFKKLGYDHFRAKLNLQDTTITKDLFNYIAMNPNIVAAKQTIGGPDFEFDMEVKDFNMFMEELRAMKKAFPKAIRDYKYIRFEKYDKIVYLPV